MKSWAFLEDRVAGRIPLGYNVFLASQNLSCLNTNFNRTRRGDWLLPEEICFAILVSVGAEIPALELPIFNQKTPTERERVGSYPCENCDPTVFSTCGSWIGGTPAGTWRIDDRGSASSGPSTSYELKLIEGAAAGTVKIEVLKGMLMLVPTKGTPGTYFATLPSSR